MSESDHSFGLKSFLVDEKTFFLGTFQFLLIQPPGGWRGVKLKSRLLALRRFHNLLRCLREKDCHSSLIHVYLQTQHNNADVHTSGTSTHRRHTRTWKTQVNFGLYSQRSEVMKRRDCEAQWILFRCV